jgi:hypothetical protein
MARRQPSGHLHDHPARREQQSFGVIDRLRSADERWEARWSLRGSADAASPPGLQ